MRRIPVLSFLFQLPPTPPPFRFNDTLYRELVRERGNGKSLKAPDGAPIVDFSMGPIDGVLGQYNSLTRRITIDVLEIFLATLHTGFSGVNDLRRRFDHRMTHVLAHEGGHWHLDRRVGKLVQIEKTAIHTVVMLVGLLAFWAAINSIGRLLFALLFPWLIHVAGVVVGVCVVVLLLVGAIIATVNAARLFLAFWAALAFAITYKVCTTERFARGFENRVDSDPRWEGVVEVD